MNGNDASITGVKIIRSKKRRKTVAARLDNNTMLVYAPYAIPDDKLNKIINRFKEKFLKNILKKRLNQKQSLKDIAAQLNKKYMNNRIDISSLNIEYVTNQTQKFGCCNYRDKTIRISHRVAQMPDWVRDYVIIHELAHLIEPNHGKSFWSIVSGYNLSERAKGYLIAKGMEMETENETDYEKEDNNV